MSKPVVRHSNLNGEERVALESSPLLLTTMSTSSTEESSNSNFSSMCDLIRSLLFNITPRSKKCYILGEEVNARMQKFCEIIYALRFFALFVLLLAGFSRLLLPQIPSDFPNTPPPFSKLDPVHDLGLFNYVRPEDSSPSMTLKKLILSKQHERALPTNSWYQNMLLPRDEPSILQRVYTIPYIVDVVGQIPGLRIHPSHVGGGGPVVQVSVRESHAITLGAAEDASKSKGGGHSHKYSVASISDLGITLEWDAFPMSSSIVQGMPYGTMLYDKFEQNSVLPTILSEIGFKNNPIADEDKEIICASQELLSVLVHKEIKMIFEESDFTWLAFFSEPVWIQCYADDSGLTMIQVVERSGTFSQKRSPLVVRVALLDPCSTGINPIHCAAQQWDEDKFGKRDYETLIRQNAHLYPGDKTNFNYDVNPEANEARMNFDWDVRDMKHPETKLAQQLGDPSNIITFALPHHIDLFATAERAEEVSFCTASLIGPACIVKGSVWNLIEELPEISFRAPRPPQPQFVPALVDALQQDINFNLPEYYRRGAGDTYFSGKQLAKLGRILLVAEEVEQICAQRQSNIRQTKDPDDQVEEYMNVCKNKVLPSDEEIDNALTTLRNSLSVWVNGTAEVPFVYDSKWGGIVSCGCNFNGNGCDNIFPNCPAFSDPGLDFGNGFYNDHHFHYGYLIYAAAIVAHFDQSWGREQFENILMLVRDVANPSIDDTYFPTFRHKDWYRGNSWASGIAMPYLNGKNQESSSEAIAAYEAIALYGSEMALAWQNTKSPEKAQVAMKIRDAGRLLAATELRATKRYWHVHRKKESLNIYPPAYNAHVIGIMWSTMAQFQTYFGNKPYLTYGIQLLPLTPISEQRDDIDWVKAMYVPFAASCASDSNCAAYGWSILQLAMLATVGHSDLAARNALQLSPEVFTSAGGDGHSLSNLLWYIATRPNIDDPLDLRRVKTSSEDRNKKDSLDIEAIDCYTPDQCNDTVLSTLASSNSCRDRIHWLMQVMDSNQRDACAQVAGEYPKECGNCYPGDFTLSKESSDDENNNVNKECPSCSAEECAIFSEKCPGNDYPFYVCTAGLAVGGCSVQAWEAEDSVQCTACCKLTDC